MPWDGSRIVVAGREGDAPRVVAGGDDEAVGQPRWSPDGRRLGFVTDRDGWWNVWTVAPDGHDARPVLPEPCEQAEPPWGPGQRSYAWSPDGTEVALVRNEDGFGRLVIVGAGGRHGARHRLASRPRLGSGRDRRGALRGPHAEHRDRAARHRPAPRRPRPRRGVRDRRPRRAGGGDVARARRDAGARAALAADPSPVRPGVAHRRCSSTCTAARPGRRRWRGAPPHRSSPAGAGRSSPPTRPDRRATAARTPRRSRASGAGRTSRTSPPGSAAGDRGWCDPARVVVSGGSAGALTALLVCARHPDLVRA